MKRRFSRFLPLSWAVILVASIVAGVLYDPNNWDAFAYRLPRILAWLHDEKWSWVTTSYQAMNVRSTGQEWLMAPLVELTRSIWPVFVLNIVFFALLPGSCFGILRALRVPGRVARYWMWVLPSGYCFATQAGGMGNDLFSATYLLMVLDFALRARTSERAVFGALVVSGLAAALLSSAKLSNLPLGLAWLVAIAPAVRRHWRQLIARPVSALGWGGPPSAPPSCPGPF